MGRKYLYDLRILQDLLLFVWPSRSLLEVRPVAVAVGVYFMHLQATE